MCGRPSPSKAFTTTPSEEPSPAPIGTRPGWSSGGLKDGVQEQHSRSPQNPAVSAMPAPLSSGSPRILPHFTDVETEARRRAGIPRKFAQQVPGSYSTPSPGLVGATQRQGGPQHRAANPMLTLAGCVCLDKPFNLSVPLSPCP